MSVSLPTNKAEETAIARQQLGIKYTTLGEVLDVLYYMLNM
jgi:hypothetical protein